MHIGAREKRRSVLHRAVEAVRQQRRVQWILEVAAEQDRRALLTGLACKPVEDRAGGAFAAEVESRLVQTRRGEVHVRVAERRRQHGAVEVDYVLRRRSISASNLFDARAFDQYPIRVSVASTGKDRSVA